MIIACDKTNFRQIKDDNEYVYVFDNEPLKDLLETGLHCIRYDKVRYVDINTTRFDIRCKKKAKITDDFTFKKRDYKIAIVIPNRNYAEFLDKCFTSILNQTYKNYEVIFVDDMSTDNSVKVAKTYKEKFDKVCKEMKIIQLQQRRLNGGSRNVAYLYVDENTDYIYYIDADDWFYDEHALKKINEALIGEPDVLFVSIAKCRNNITTREKTPQYKDRYEAMEGWSGSCGKVIKKSLATRQECLYNEGTLQEDRNQHRKICIYMNDFKCLEDLIYVWNQDNRKSTTTIRDKATWKTSAIRQYADTMQLALTVKGQDDKIDKILEESLQRCKNEVLTNGDRQY